MSQPSRIHKVFCPVEVGLKADESPPPRGCFSRSILSCLLGEGKCWQKDVFLPLVKGLSPIQQRRDSGTKGASS